MFIVVKRATKAPLSPQIMEKNNYWKTFFWKKLEVFAVFFVNLLILVSAIILISLKYLSPCSPHPIMQMFL